MSEKRKTPVDLRGWGPDWTAIDALCMVPDCPWEYTWDDAVNLDEVNRVVQQHVEVAHGEH
jgi:hypothetical protein